MKKTKIEKLEILEIFKTKMLRKGWDSKIILKDCHVKKRSEKINVSIEYRNIKKNYFIIQNISDSYYGISANFEFYIFDELIDTQRLYSYDNLFGDYLDVIIFGDELFENYESTLKEEKELLNNQIFKIDLKLKELKKLI
jgi:hypothetical protein